MLKRSHGIKAKCDSLFSKIIRSKGFCECCGSTDYLQTSHIMGRRFSATRCDIRNAQCLCAKCHRFFTDHPVEFTRWIFESVGEPLYIELAALAHSNVKTDWAAVYEELKRLELT